MSEYKYSNDAYIKQLLNHDIKYFEPIITFLNNQIKNKNISILDYGCGTGNLVSVLNKNGYPNVMGIDIDSNSVKAGQKAGIKNIFIIDDINLTDKKFDLVISNHVLEHVNHVHDFLNILWNLTNQNGILYIRTPNYLNPRTYIYYIKSKLKNNHLHLTPFNTGNYCTLMYRFLISSILTFLKLLFNNTTIWKFTPLKPKISIGGDADATWASNYLDIKNYFLKCKYPFKEKSKKSFLKQISLDIFVIEHI